MRGESMVNIQPMGDRVLVEVVLEDEQTSGGIYIPTTARETANKGIVKGIGKGTTLENGEVKPLDVNIGDLLIFNKNSGTSIKEGSVEYRIVSIRDVIGTIIE
jgi:chaperonin GroES